MKIRGVRLDDFGEPTELDVTMSVREAVALYRIFGGLNDYATEKLGMRDGDSIYGPIANLFNGFWEDGLPPWAPPKRDLASLSVAPR